MRDATIAAANRLIDLEHQSMSVAEQASGSFTRTQITAFAARTGTKGVLSRSRLP